MQSLLITPLTVVYIKFSTTPFQILDDLILNLIFYRKAFHSLLQRRKQFLKETEMNCKNGKLSWMLNGFQLFVSLFTVLCTIAVTYSLVLSFYSGQLIVPIWYTEGHPLLQNCLYYIQWVWFCFISLVEYASICFFNGLCYEVGLQFKLLNRMAREALKDCVRMNSENSFSSLKNFVSYHRFLIRCVRYKLPVSK